MRWIRRMVRTRKMFTKMFTPPRSQLQWKWQMRRGHDENDDESAFVIDLQSQSNKILIYFKISISSPHLLSLLLLRRSHPWGNKFSMNRSFKPASLNWVENFTMPTCWPCWRWRQSLGAPSPSACRQSPGCPWSWCPMSPPSPPSLRIW